MLRAIFRLRSTTISSSTLVKACFNTTETKQSGKFLQQIKDVFVKRAMDDHLAAAEEKKQEIDYNELAKKVQTLAIENKDVAAQLMQIHREILQVQQESYKTKGLDTLLSSVPSSDLCEFAAQQFVGSLSIPKNEKIMQMFMEYAVKNAKTDEEKNQVEFFTLYLRKLAGIQQGNKEEFQAASDELIRLCNEKEHPIAMHIIAKEVYKVGLNILNSKYKKNKQEYFNQAIELFSKAAEKGSFQSFFYMAEMAENGDFPGGVDLKLAFDYYLIAAAFNNAQAYFRLAKFYREGLVEKKNPELEYTYTKQAAELGLTEAQHNLGCMYVEGRIVEYDSLKAMAWFSHAGAAGFAHSQYNAARLHIEGGKDGKIMTNYSAAMAWLDRIHKDGKIDVNRLVAEVHSKLEEQERLQKQAMRGQTEMLVR